MGGARAGPTNPAPRRGSPRVPVVAVQSLPRPRSRRVMPATPRALRAAGSDSHQQVMGTPMPSLQRETESRRSWASQSPHICQMSGPSSWVWVSVCPAVKRGCKAGEWAQATAVLLLRAGRANLDPSGTTAPRESKCVPATHPELWGGHIPDTCTDGTPGRQQHSPS